MLTDRQTTDRRHNVLKARPTCIPVGQKPVN